MLDLANAKRLVIKTGSSLVTDDKGQVRAAWLHALAQDITHLRAQNTQIILVTSGAVSLGRSTLGVSGKTLKLEEKQAAAACGQPLLMSAWRQALEKENLAGAQLLLTLQDSEDRRRYLNARNTLDTLLQAGVIPIINENDSVTTAEIRVGDNDRLAARVAQMAGADMLIMLSDIDGLYSESPGKNPDAKFISEVKQITPEIEAMAGGIGSAHGSGGMVTKLAAAKIALAAGCHMAIARGKDLHPVKQLMEGGRCTWFIASATPLSARKHWISGTIQPTGSVTVDDGGVRALKSGKSLLPAGVKKVEGTFDRGDTVFIKSLGGDIVGKGLIAYSARDCTRILGRKSSEIEAILGFKGRDTLIHRDDMVLG